MTNTLLYITEITSLQKIVIRKTFINLKNGIFTMPISYQLEGTAIKLLTINEKSSSVLKLKKAR